MAEKKAKEEVKGRSSMPAFKLKQIGSRLIVYAIEKFGDSFYKRLQESMGLNKADLEKIMHEVDFYYDRAVLRCPHIDGINLREFAGALEEATFEEWSESSKQVRIRKS